MRSMIGWTTRRDWLATALAAAAGIAVAVSGWNSFACDPEYLPICGRSAYLAKFVNQIVVNPATAVPIGVPVGLVPHVEWNNQNTLSCAQPTSHSLSLTVTCAEQGGTGTQVVIGPVNVPMQDVRPTVPGNQPVAGGSPFNLVIGASVLDPTKQYRCTVVGAYTIDFGPVGKRGAGPIIGTGDTVFYLVRPSPADATQPILYAQALGTTAGFARGRQGDQVYHSFVVANNHLTAPVMIGTRIATKNAAGVPGGSANEVFSIASPRPGADAFPVTFVGNLSPGRRLTLGDPQTAVGAANGVITLGAGAITVLNVATETHGMCAKGSCNEALLELDAVWKGAGVGGADLTSLGCVGFVTQVDNSVSASDALCAATDTLSVTASADVQSSRLVFDDIASIATHVGNHPRNDGMGYAYRTVGSMLAPLIDGNISGLFPTQHTDQLRFSAGERWLPSSYEFSNAAFILPMGGSNLVSSFNTNIVRNIPATGMSLTHPQIESPAGGGIFRNEVDYGRGMHKVFQKVGNRDRLIFAGDAEGFFTTDKFKLNFGITRSVQLSCPPLDFRRLATIPYGVGYNLAENEATLTDTGGFTVINPLNPADAGSVTVESDPHIIVPGSVQFGSSVDVRVTGGSAVPLAPEPPCWTALTVSAPNARPVEFYAAKRRIPDMTPPPAALVIRSISITIALDRDGNDQVTVQVEVDIEQGFDPDGVDACADVGGLDFGMRSDARGNFRPTFGPFAKPAKPKPAVVKGKLAFKKQGGTVPAQTAVLTMSASRVNLSGHLFDEGLRDEDLTDAPRQVPVRVLFDGKLYAGVANVEVDSVAGKKLKAKSARP